MNNYVIKSCCSKSCSNTFMIETHKMFTRNLCDECVKKIKLRGVQIEEKKTNRDLRLYTYSSGSLIRCGRGKTGIHKHFYNKIEDIEKYINKIKNVNGKIGGQFIIVEYFSKYHSKIIKIIE